MGGYSLQTVVKTFYYCLLGISPIIVKRKISMNFLNHSDYVKVLAIRLVLERLIELNEFFSFVEVNGFRFYINDEGDIALSRNSGNDVSFENVTDAVNHCIVSILVESISDNFDFTDDFVKSFIDFLKDSNVYS